MEFVGEEESALGIMRKFDQIYLKESTTLQIFVRNRLEKIKLKYYDDSSTFLTDFEKIINKLKNSGANVSEKEKLNYLLRTLPDSLSYIGDLIDAVKESDQTCEFVKNKIQMWVLRDKGDNNCNQNKSSAFKVEKKFQRNTCFGCGKPGHLKINCRYMGERSTGRGCSSSEAQWLEAGRSIQHQFQQHQGNRTRGYGDRSYGVSRNNGFHGGRGSSWRQQNEDERQRGVRYHGRNRENNDTRLTHNPVPILTRLADIIELKRNFI